MPNSRRTGRQTPETAEAHGANAGRQQTGTDKVELFSYIPVVPASQSSEGTRASRVQELKIQIANGTYEVLSVAVAHKMFSKFAMD